eukprot:TRINITY_DN801_c0_g1_i5.p1 TRINITY_DN801_c0_g1~~TRINITY_DN801_c0_g1_i5.p1  ORF type:complete len:437 (+),score=50.17 TRINITY_DN801_c0_g1_i5:198-1508(+)
MNFKIIILLFGLILLSSATLNVTTDVTESLSKILKKQLNYSIITGFLPIDWYFRNTDTSIFFQFVTKNGTKFSNIKVNEPVVFWFNGGPGCSSQIGSWSENGPLSVNGTQFYELKSSWNRLANLVYIDQPLNVGFSYSSVPGLMVNSTAIAAQHFVNFLYNFYQTFPQLKKNPTYFFGESFGGHYIPGFARAVVSNSSAFGGVNFQGIGIGDGWTIADIQTQQYSLYYQAAGIASSATGADLQRQEDLENQYQQSENYFMASAMFDNMTNNTDFYGNVDIYNFEQYGDGEESDDFSIFLGDAVWAQQNYGIPKEIPAWQFCDDPMYNAFYLDLSQSRKQDIEYLLAQYYQVTLYNGQLDIIVNTPGAVEWINTIEWQYINQWQNQQKTFWYNTNQTKIYGSYKTYANFAFVSVYGAGHLVPTDQPSAALDLSLIHI